MKVAVVLTVLAVASIPAEGTSKLLPAVRTSLSLGSTLLRHLAQIKDRLREDVERHLLRNSEHAYPVQIFKLPMWHKSVLARPWVSPQFHSSFSYQAAGTGGLPVLPFPFFPPPMRPAVVLVPCRHPRTHIAQVIFPCISVVGTGAGLGAPQISIVQGTGNKTTNVTDVTTSGLAENDPFPRLRTTTVANEDPEEEEGVTENSPTVVPSTQADDVTETGATTSTAPSTRFTAGTAETTTVDSATTSTSEEDTPVTDAGTTINGAATTEAPNQSSATLPEDRQANTIPDSTRLPATTLTATKESSEPDFSTVDVTESNDFNEVLKGAQVSFGKLVYE